MGCGGSKSATNTENPTNVNATQYTSEKKTEVVREAPLVVQSAEETIETNREEAPKRSSNNNPEAQRTNNPSGGTNYSPSVENKQPMSAAMTSARITERIVTPPGERIDAYAKEIGKIDFKVSEDKVEPGAYPRTVMEKAAIRPPEDDGTLRIFFFFDFEAKTFYFYDILTKQWNQNDLNYSLDDCPRCPLFKFRVKGEEAEAIQFARYMNYIAYSNDVIFLIGGYNSYYSCLEYNISKNMFYCRQPLKTFRNNPSLCRQGRYIYAVSGDLLDKFSSDVAQYDVRSNGWIPLPDLPGPQGYAAVSVIKEKEDFTGVQEVRLNAMGQSPAEDEESSLLAVVGGLSQKFPKTYTSLISLYYFRDREWNTIDLSKIVTQRVPRFINCVFTQNKEGDLIILGCENSRTVYKFDMLDMKLSTVGRLPNDEVFSEPMRSKEVLYRDNQVYCLAHKLNMKVYRGLLTVDKWEVL